ncbi:MAG: 30S ribosomal protein S5 [Methanosarcinales archaeon]|nr:30S ribosomal protein S5 [Methanosarcinales archaeon]RLG20880.1 MAG: 30S ribosomal protein S5 [Methanosarcinales archaeon]
MEEEWIPRTKLGTLVREGKITDIDTALDSGLPLREVEIIEILLPELAEEVLDVNMVQRMTDSGRRVKFRAVSIVGNKDGYIGFGQGKDRQAGPAIRKSIANAKLHVIGIKRGCGSWECGCSDPHSVPFLVNGKSGSVGIELKPAPRGLGIASGATAKKVLEMAGIKDVWTRTWGTTRTTLNFAKATYDALRQTTMMRSGGR